MRRVALAGVVVNAGIVSTGAAVRLSDSGLGCLDWPTCTKTSLVAAGRAGEPMFHTWIEFGNRTLTGVLELIAVAVLVAAWRFRPGGRRRPDLVWLAALQPVAVLLQAVIGGVVVLTNLSPGWVAGHFLVSVAVVAAAVTLHVRCTEGTSPPRSLVRPDLRLLSFAVAAVAAAMLTAGTVVTGTGPLAGAGDVPRFHFWSLAGITQLHADIGWLLGGLTGALALGLRFSGAPARAVRLGWTLLGLLAAQGTVGYVQYFSRLPAGLVWVHASLSVVVWVVVLRLIFAGRDRGPLVTEPPAAAAATGLTDVAATAGAPPP
jgi:cytochrome c oxidase assembly protein subunit 15